jgi:hypothetical protein
VTSTGVLRAGVTEADDEDAVALLATIAAAAEQRQALLALGIA